jgi:hypothetical protein
VSWNKNLLGWSIPSLFAMASVFFVMQVYDLRKLIRLGYSPHDAVQVTGQHMWHLLLNPFVFIPYVILLAAALWFVLYRRHSGQSIEHERWFAAALIVSMGVLLFHLFRGH